MSFSIQKMLDQLVENRYRICEIEISIIKIVYNKKFIEKFEIKTKNLLKLNKLEKKAKINRY